jgi:flagellar biosynthetic protein FliO
MNELPVDQFPEAPGLGLSWVVLFLLALIVLASYLHRRFGQPVRGDGLRMVSSLSLGDKRAIVMIEADDERLLVGVTSSNVQLISRLASGGGFGAGSRSGPGSAANTRTTLEDVHAGSTPSGGDVGMAGAFRFRSLLRAATARKART